MLWVLTFLLYSCETWIVYRRHIKLLEHFHQCCLCTIQGIHWITYTSDSELLQRANSISVEAHIHKHRQHHWTGHVSQLEDHSKYHIDDNNWEELA